MSLARYLTTLNGADPDTALLRKVGERKNCAVPAWQEHWTLAGAVLEVLDGHTNHSRSAGA